MDDVVRAIRDLEQALKEGSESNNLQQMREHLREASVACGRLWRAREREMRAPPNVLSSF